MTAARPRPFALIAAAVAIAAIAPGEAVAAAPTPAAHAAKKKKKPAPLTATVSGTFTIKQNLEGGFGNDGGPNWQQLKVEIKNAALPFDGPAQFGAAANSLQGSGWALLVWDPLGKRLNINQLYDQQGNLPVGQLPVLQLDMWEHAFYLQYKNVKADYVTAWWNVVNWTDVATRLAKARAADIL